MLYSCKIVKPNNDSDIWNGYNNACRSNQDVQLQLFHGKSVYNGISFKPGFILLNSGDTISGAIGIAPVPIWSQSENIVIMRGAPSIRSGLMWFYGKRNNKQMNTVDHNCSEIKYFRTSSDSTINGCCYSDYFNLCQDCAYAKYWRLLKRKGDDAIYDNFSYGGILGTKNAHFSRMILWENNKIIKLYKYGPFHSIKGSLKRFINKRYKANTDKNDFKTIREMINYILDEENKKLSQNK